MQAGELFYFDIHLFDLKHPAQDHLTLTLAQLAAEGLGPDRKRVELLRVDSLAEDGGIITLPLRLETSGATRLALRFITPTELKSGSQLAARPEFAILAARVRDRISALCEFYGDGAPPIDFKCFAERAGLVRMTRCDVHAVAINRRSSRTGQIHSIGGFVGEAEYEGPIAEFIPWLNAARWTGVGRQTVWGKGMIEFERS